MGQRRDVQVIRQSLVDEALKAQDGERDGTIGVEDHIIGELS